MNTKQGQLSAVGLKPYLLGCGYSKTQLVTNIEVTNGHRFHVPLTAFAHYPYDSRSACIAVLDDVFDPEAAVKACRSLGAPLVFTCLPDQLLLWKQSVTGPQLEDRIPLAKLSEFFKRHRDNLAPEAVYRAKTWARFDTQYQLSFVDLGLMPLVEEEAGKKLSELIERVVADVKARLGWKEISQEQGQWLLKANFWLLAAKILKDKGVPAFSDLDLENLDNVYACVAKHYGSSVPVPVGSKQQRLALQKVAQEISRFGHLGLVSTEALAYLYEHALISKETRAALGTHSTPGYLVDYIVGKLLPWIKEMPAEQRHVFEPACGHAAFLLAAMRLLGELPPVNTYTPSKRHQYFRHRLHGNDQDTFALEEIARLSLTLGDIPNSDGWDLKVVDIFRGNVLVHYAREAGIVLANPPFGDFKPDESRLLTGESAQPKYVNKAAEMLWRVTSEMKPGAVFGVVLPQGFLHDKNASSLRQFIATNFEINEICLLPDNIFTISGAESAVILGRRLFESPTKPRPILYRRIRESEAKAFKETYASSQDKIIQSSCFGEANQWSFLVPELEEVWKYCQKYPTFDEIAEIGKGFEFLAKSHLKFPEGAITESAIRKPGLDEGFAKLRRTMLTHQSPNKVWFNLNPVVIGRPRHGTKKGIPQVLFNYAPVSRGKWRLKAFFDDQGHPFTTRFLCVRPREKKWPIEALWGICNSPFANAYAYTHTGKREIPSVVMRNMPVPKVQANDLMPLMSAVREYLQAVQKHEDSWFSLEDTDKLKILHWRIDAEVLRLYNLPGHLERQVLDLFIGEKRLGVPFEQDQYFPREFKEPLALRDLLAITVDWGQTNERRTALIFKKVKMNISVEERLELDELQRLADCRIRLLAPLPLQEMEAVKQDLVRRGMWEGN